MTYQEIAIKLVEKYGTQKSAADACGVSQPTISNLVNGKKTNVKADTAEKLKNGLKHRARNV